MRWRHFGRLFLRQSNLRFRLDRPRADGVGRFIHAPLCAIIIPSANWQIYEKRMSAIRLPP